MRSKLYTMQVIQYKKQRGKLVSKRLRQPTTPRCLSVPYVISTKSLHTPTAEERDQQIVRGFELLKQRFERLKDKQGSYNEASDDTNRFFRDTFDEHRRVNETLNDDYYRYLDYIEPKAERISERFYEARSCGQQLRNIKAQKNIAVESVQKRQEHFENLEAVTRETTSVTPEQTSVLQELSSLREELSVRVTEEANLIGEIISLYGPYANTRTDLALLTVLDSIDPITF